MSSSRLSPRRPKAETRSTRRADCRSSNACDTLAIAVSQSGTTTDTNRTVDLVRARGAKVIAIVNRRNSALVQKANSHLYTGNGRDVEMSVALRLLDHADGPDIRLTLVDGADHRFSDDECLELIERSVEEVLARVG